MNDQPFAMHLILKHQWLSFRRSPSFEKDLGVKIFLAVMGIFFLFYIVLAALSLDTVIQDFKGEMNSVNFINQFLLYYFLTELVIRYFMQTVPILDVAPYLHLPISKKLVASFLLIKSFFSPYNLLAPAIFVPIYYKIVLPELGLQSAITWLIFNLLLSLSLHFFNILFKKKFENNLIAWSLIILASAAHYVSFNYFNFQLFPLNQLLNHAMNTSFYVALPLALMISLIAICYRFFTSHLYTEDLADDKILSGEKFTSKFGDWEKKGLVNTLIIQELKLILRHKRSKSSLLISAIFLFYPLIILNRSGDDSSPMFMFMLVSVLLTGTFIMNYGQFLWSWNSNQMDFFLTKINPYTQWVESRYRLLLYSAIITGILAVPYLFFSTDMIWAIIAAAIYNMGINSMLIMRMSLWGPKAIDLNKGSMMNYQGVGAAQFLIGLPVVIGPMIIYGIFSGIWGAYIGILTIAIAGLIGIALRKIFFNAIAKKLQKDKYKLIYDLTI